MPNAPPVIALETNLSGVLVNSMESFQYPRLYPETMVNVGGMHIAGRSDVNRSLSQVTGDQEDKISYRKYQKIHVLGNEGFC